VKEMFSLIIKITGCSGEKLWYKDYIGETFETHNEKPFEMPVIGLVSWVKGRNFSYVKENDYEVISE
jgi:hypothetical protein